MSIRTSYTQGCDLCATVERPENWPGRSVVTQTQKVMLLCNCCSITAVRSLNHRKCCSGTTGRAKEAEWSWNIAMVAQGWPRSPNRGRVIGTVITQWSAKGGTMVARGRQKHRSNLYTMLTTVCLFIGKTNGRPLCIHSATTAIRVPSSFEAMLPNLVVNPLRLWQI